jgi:hypothetical protein
MPPKAAFVRLATPDDALALARSRDAFRAAMGAAVEDEAAFVARCAEWMRARLAPGGPWGCSVVDIMEAVLDGGRDLAHAHAAGADR